MSKYIKMQMVVMTKRDKWKFDSILLGEPVKFDLEKAINFLAEPYTTRSLWLSSALEDAGHGSLEDIDDQFGSTINWNIYIVASGGKDRLYSLPLTAERSSDVKQILTLAYDKAIT